MPGAAWLGRKRVLQGGTGALQYPRPGGWDRGRWGLNFVCSVSFFTLFCSVPAPLWWDQQAPACLHLAAGRNGQGCCAVLELALEPSAQWWLHLTSSETCLVLVRSSENMEDPRELQIEPKGCEPGDTTCVCTKAILNL